MIPKTIYPDIAVIIVNYGTAALAIAGVQSVLDHCGPEVEVHLVDNNSPENDYSVIESVHQERNWGKQVKLYPEKINHGFGRGNNLVLKILAERPVPPAKVLLLNPDAHLANDVVNILSGFLDAHPEAGLAGASICRPDGTPVSAAFRFHSLFSELESTIRLGFVSRFFRRQVVALPPDQPTGKVDWVSGAAVMFRYNAVTDVGFFDPDFFLYYEEADLMRRMAVQGWEAWHVSEARVVHAEGASTKVRSHDVPRRRPPYWYDSRRLYFEKNHGRLQASLIAMTVLLATGLNKIITALRRRRSSLPLQFGRDYSRYVFWPLLFGPRSPRS
ncbi:MAG: glycosyltransferase family 2 protein [Pseudomonadota bacterium]